MHKAPRSTLGTSPPRPRIHVIGAALAAIAMLYARPLQDGAQQQPPARDLYGVEVARLARELHPLRAHETLYESLRWSWLPVRTIAQAREAGSDLLLSRINHQCAKNENPSPT